MAQVTIRYWAAAKEAAGVAEEAVDARTLAEALDVVLARRPPDTRLRTVIDRSSFLVDGLHATPDLVLRESAVVEVLPQFAGGLAKSADWVCITRLLRHTGRELPSVSIHVRSEVSEHEQEAWIRGPAASCKAR
jgi:molybdopterin converting factor small subunit